MDKKGAQSEGAVQKRFENAEEAVTQGNAKEARRLERCRAMSGPQWANLDPDID